MMKGLPTTFSLAAIICLFSLSASAQLKKVKVQEGVIKSTAQANYNQKPDMAEQRALSFFRTAVCGRKDEPCKGRITASKIAERFIEHNKRSDEKNNDDTKDPNYIYYTDIPNIYKSFDGNGLTGRLITVPIPILTVVPAARSYDYDNNEITRFSDILNRPVYRQIGVDKTKMWVFYDSAGYVYPYVAETGKDDSLWVLNSGLYKFGDKPIERPIASKIHVNDFAEYAIRFMGGELNEKQFIGHIRRHRRGPGATLTEPRTDAKASNTDALTPRANIQKLWIDHEVYDKQEKGMRIHFTFNAWNLNGKTCKANVYFYNASGKPLKDTNDKFSTPNGNVAMHGDFTPTYERSVYKDFQLFMPYDELHMPTGEFKLKLKANLHCEKLGFIAQSEDYTFSYSRK